MSVLPTLSAAEALRTRQDGHQRCLEERSAHPHRGFDRVRALAAGRRPIAAVLGCADSRVPVELVFDPGFGNLFVVRNAGNTPGPAAISAALSVGEHSTPNLSRLVGAIRMQLLQDGVADDLDQACRHNVKRADDTLVESSVLLTDAVR
jgi:carbonic anhydrase